MTWQELEKANPHPFDKLTILGQGFIILKVEVANLDSEPMVIFETIKERNYEAYIKHNKLVAINGQYITVAEAEGIDYPERINWRFSRDSFSQMELLKGTTLVRAKEWIGTSNQVSDQ